MPWNLCILGAVCSWMQESLEFRMHLRYEILMLGILPIVNKLKALNITHLNR